MELFNKKKPEDIMENMKKLTKADDVKGVGSFSEVFDFTDANKDGVRDVLEHLKDEDGNGIPDCIDKMD